MSDQTGTMEAPEEWILSLVCEEFHCLPHQAVEALENDVGGIIFKIISLRAYKSAKDVYDSTPMDKRPNTPMVRMVSDITMQLAKERIERLRKGSNEEQEEHHTVKFV